MENNQQNEQQVQEPVAQELVATAEDLKLIKIMWILIIFFNILSPILFYFIKGDSSAYIKKEAQKCLNTGITVTIVLFACTLLSFLVLPPILAFIYALVIFIRGVMASFKNQPYVEKWVFKIIK